MTSCEGRAYFFKVVKSFTIISIKLVIILNIDIMPCQANYDFFHNYIVVNFLYINHGLTSTRTAIRLMGL
jgi:hypothetical protein